MSIETTRSHSNPKIFAQICDRSVSSASNCSEGWRDGPKNRKEPPNAIEKTEFAAPLGFQPHRFGTKPEPARVLCRHSPPDQPRGGNHQSKRAGYAASKSIPGQRAIKEHGYNDRAVAEGCPRPGPALQPRADRIQSR